MTPAVIQSWIREVISPDAIVVAFTDEGDGHGMVAWVRESFDAFVTHRWADHDTAGNPLSPMFFWSGGYYHDPRKWIDDFEKRGGQPWPQN